MDSSTESSLIAALENSDYRGIHRRFSDYLKPFADFIVLNEDADSKKPKKTQKSKKKTEPDWTQIRPLAKKFLPFLNRSLSLLPKRLSESPKPGCGEEDERAQELFDTYKLCLDCLSCLSSQLSCKPYSMHCQRIRLVHCFEAWGRFGEAECEVRVILESLRSISLAPSGSKPAKGKKNEDGLLPDMTKENADPDLALLLVEVVATLVKCTFMSKSKDGGAYRSVLSLLDQLGPWFRVLDAKVFERLHGLLVTNLNKCLLFMVGESTCFDGDLLNSFCMITLTEFLKSSMKDQFVKFARRICSSLFLHPESGVPVIIDILRCALISISCECKVAMVCSVNEFLDLACYCANKCRTANINTDKVATLFNEVASELHHQDLTPVDLILKLYAAGLFISSNDVHSRGGGTSITESSKEEFAIRLLFGNEDNLQHLDSLLHSLESHFFPASSENGISYSGGEMDPRGISCLTMDSMFDISKTCKHKHGVASLLSYLNALEFLCQPFSELVNTAKKHILAESEVVFCSTKNSYIQDVFHQFCNVFFICFRCTSEKERDRFNDSRKTLLHVAVAALTVSLGMKKSVQRSVDCIDHIISNGWVQYQELKFLVAALYNVAVILYRSKQVKEALVALRLCCRASWTCVSCLCHKFMGKQEGSHDLSEDAVKDFVNETCAKSAFLLDVLYQCGSPDVDESIVDSLLNWSIAGNLLKGLNGPMSLVKQWVKIICKDYKGVDMEDHVPTLYSLLSKSSPTWSKRTVGVILEQELLAYEEMMAQLPNLCQRMQLEIMNTLLLDVYVTKENWLQKSRIFIRKGGAFRAQGIEYLDSCIQCLSEAICILNDISREPSSSSCSVHHQLAIAYSLRALCTQETEPNSKLILHDIHHAVKLWLGIITQDCWSNHCEFVTENLITLLYRIADLLLLKGSMQFQCDIYKLIIILLKRKNVSLEKSFSMLWANRRLAHALCISPVDEAFIVDFTEQYGVHCNSIDFWISCLKESKPLLIGFQQKFSLSSSIFPLRSHHPKSYLGIELTLDEVKEVVSDLMSRVPVPKHSAFLAGYLCYDLAERLISSGRLLEALSYAREARSLRSKLLKEKFIYSIEQTRNCSESGEATECHKYGHFNLAILGSVATEVWPGVTNSESWDMEDCILSPWNVLQCYLESTLQVGVIYEAIGNGAEAEALLLGGKSISCIQGLQLFNIAFSSTLGKIYHNKKHWDLAENELNICKQTLVDVSTTISCKQCKLALEVSIDQQIADLTRSRFSCTEQSSLKSLTFAIDLYKSSLEKINPSEWENSLSIPVNISTVEAGGSREVEVRKPRKPKNASKHTSKEQTKADHNPRITRSRKQSSGNGGLVMQQETMSVAHYGCEESCFCDKANCWTCFLMKVMEDGSMKDFISTKWELHNRRLSIRLLIGIGKCIGIHGEIHKVHEIFWQCISALSNAKKYSHSYAGIPHTILLEFIDIGRPGDIFAIERATILYNICWFSLKNYQLKDTRVTCCDMSQIQISRIVSWLMQAFILCRELPLLFQKDLETRKVIGTARETNGIYLLGGSAHQEDSETKKSFVSQSVDKVSRLLAAIFLLSTSGGLFYFPFCSGKSLSRSHWAAYFHQASLGTHLNYLFFSSMSAKLKGQNFVNSQVSNVIGSTSTITETCNLHRVAPEKVEDLEEFVTGFFVSLPTTTVICISLLGGGCASLLRGMLNCPSSLPWMLLSRLNSKRRPIVTLLPLNLVLQESLDDVDDDDDAIFRRGSISEENGSSKKWSCPWGYTVVDDVAPLFKSILEENYLSSSVSPLDDTQKNRLLWWTRRKKLDYRLGKLLRDIEDSWLGPWKCLLLGEHSECKHLESVLQKLMDDLKHKSEDDAHENLLRVIFGGAVSVSEADEYVSQLLHKCYSGSSRCCGGEKCSAFSITCDGIESLSSKAQQLILEVASGLECKCGNREPVILVLDSEIQMLPWENIPILRKQEVYRMPSVGSIFATLSKSFHPQEQIGKVVAAFPSIDPLDAFYLLNPSGDLSHTQVEFEDWFKNQKLKGKAGTAPAAEELMVALKNHDLFIYFGHGSGTQYISGHEIQKLERCAATVLMGCSSGSLSLMGCYTPQGAPLSYLLAGSPAIVANLWEVTDKDIDRFGRAMLAAWLQERSTSSIDCGQCNLVSNEFGSLRISRTMENSKKGRRKKLQEAPSSDTCKDCSGQRPKIGSFMSQAREACTLPFLIGASPVCYGVPTAIGKKKDL
ncbi:PREDICTED: separase isoform X3 [Nelumbo nucifera]|uniref:separase n=1 Tax=Nelumbo nucifera TaxID=4432 RepID=A0A1U7Z538_NELNU|nr:PREDICTED: separase isoform X3 [Nelumbo nucifera]